MFKTLLDVSIFNSVCERGKLVLVNIASIELA